MSGASGTNISIAGLHFWQARLYISSNALHDLGVETRTADNNGCHRKISSNGLVSRKHPSHTSLTTFIACASSLHCGLARTDRAALLLTQSWWWFVNLNILFLKNSFAHLHSPLRLLARICIALSAAIYDHRDNPDTNLRTGHMPQILRIPIHLEPQMVIRMHHFVRHRVLQLALRVQIIRT